MGTLKKQLERSKRVSDAGNNFASITDKGIHYTSEGFMWISCGLLILIAVLTTSDVISRSLFDFAIPGTIELVELMLACTVFLGMVYAATKQAHVRVTVLFTRFPKRIQRVLEPIMLFIGAVVFALVSWKLWLSGAGWIASNRHTAMLNVPVGPIKLVTAVAAGVICLILIRDFLHSLHKEG